MQETKEKSSSSNRRFLIYILLLFAIPLVGAILLYISGWQPAKAGNHGQLIQPAKQIEDRDLRTLDGKTVHFSELRGKWTMLIFGPTACPAECLHNLYVMRQVQAGQGKDGDRVQRVLIATDSSATETLKKKLVDYPGMRVWTGEQKVLAELAKSFGLQLEGLSSNRYIYLIDPMGNLMMRYAPGSDPYGIIKDVTHLLKYSWVG